MVRPRLYGDAMIMRGRVVHKSLISDPPDGPVRHAVRVAIEGANQLWETVSRGYATIYLPSRDDGDPSLPLGHTVSPPYVPYAKHRQAS